MKRIALALSLFAVPVLAHADDALFSSALSVCKAQGMDQGITLYTCPAIGKPLDKLTPDELAKCKQGDTLNGNQRLANCVLGLLPEDQRKAWLASPLNPTAKH